MIILLAASVLIARIILIPVRVVIRTLIEPILLFTVAASG